MECKKRNILDLKVKDYERDNWVIRLIENFWLKWKFGLCKKIGIYIGCGGRFFFLNFNVYVVSILWMCLVF